MTDNKKIELENLIKEANTGKEESIKKIYEFFVTNAEIEKDLRIKARDYFLEKTENLDDCDPNISYYCGCMLNNINLSNIGIGGDKHIEKAIDCLIYSANNGNLDSYKELFSCTARNIRLESLQEKIKKYFDEKIKNNPNSDDLYWYGKMLKENYIKEEKKANDYFIESAKKGNFKAIEELYNYINYNINNKIEKETVENAINYFKESIKDLNKCDSSTLYYYGVMLQKGKIFEKNEKEANNYFIKAAEKGNAEAVKKLYANIIDNKENSEDFINCIKNQAKKGNSEAMYVYGEMLLNGKGVEKSEKQATDFFIKAIEKGNFEAIKKLYDYIIKNNNKEQEEIITNCVNCIKQQAEKDNSEAMYFYGKILLNDKKMEEAASFIKKASDLNNGYATLEYACMLRDGIGVKQDLIEAEKYIFKTSKLITDTDRLMIEQYYLYKNYGENLESLYEAYDSINHKNTQFNEDYKFSGRYTKGREYRILPTAAGAYKIPEMQYEYANLLLTGEENCIKKDETEAAKYFIELIDNKYNKVIDNNIYKNSLNKLIELLINNSSILEPEEKVKYYKKAVEINNDYAKYKLAECYKYGLGVKKDEEKANDLISKVPNEIKVNIKKKEKENKLYLENKQNKTPEELIMLGNYYENSLSIEQNKKKAQKFYRDAKNTYKKKAKEKINSIEKAEAMYNLAKCYENGIGTRKNIKKAKKYYLMAIEKQNTEANIKYANILIKEGKKEEAVKYLKTFDSRKETKKSEELLKEIEEEKNNKEQFENYKELVKQGDAKAKYNLAECYENGIGTKQDFQKATKLYKEEIKKGNSKAIYRIAQCYEKIAKIKSDEKYLDKAIKYYERLENNNAEACFALSNIYGKGIKKDEDKEFIYCKKAAEIGHYKASYKLAVKYYDENGLLPDKELAKYYYETAAKFGGNKIAQKRLNELNAEEDKEENNNIDIDDNKSNKDEKQEDRQEDKQGKIELYKLKANNLYRGIETPINKKEAAKYYKMAADEGDIDSAYIYSIMLKNGDGIEENKKDEVKYCKIAADEGKEKIAEFNYAEMLYSGDGVEQNKVAAAKYYKKSADKNHTMAMFKYAKMLYNGDEIEQNKEEAIKYYKMAAEKEQIDAMYDYANILEEQGDIESSIEYYKRIKNKIKFNNGKYLFYVDDINHKDQKIENLQQKIDNLNSLINDDEKKLEGAKEHYEKGLKYSKEKNYRMSRVSFELATTNYKELADKGNIEAIYYYAEMLYNGYGVNKNKEEAAKYYKMAADKGHTKAIFNYAIMLDSGDGIEKNKEEAEKYFSKLEKNEFNIENTGLIIDIISEKNPLIAIKYYRRLLNIITEDKKEYIKTKIKDLTEKVKNDLIEENNKIYSNHIVENSETKFLGDLISKENKAEFFSYAIKIASELRNLHSKGITCNYISPKNITISNKAEILSSLENPITNFKELLGVKCEAPETEDKKNFTEKSDVYLLGPIFIELFTDYQINKLEDYHKFSTKEINEIAKSINLKKFLPDQIKCNKEIEREIKKQLFKLFYGILQSDPNKRFTSAEVVMELSELIKIFEKTNVANKNNKENRNINFKEDLKLDEEIFFNLNIFNEEIIEFKMQEFQKELNFLIDNTLSEKAKKCLEIILKIANGNKIDIKTDIEYLNNFRELESDKNFELESSTISIMFNKLKKLKIAKEIRDLDKKRLELDKTINAINNNKYREKELEELKNSKYLLDYRIEKLKEILNNINLIQIKENSKVLPLDSNNQNIENFKNICLNGEVADVEIMIKKNKENIIKEINKQDEKGKTLLYKIFDKTIMRPNDIKIAIILIKNGANFGTEKNLVQIFNKNLNKNLKKVIEKAGVDTHEKEVNLGINNFRTLNLKLQNINKEMESKEHKYYSIIKIEMN